MRLGLADAEIAKRITNDPSFRGPNGQFDRTRFEQIIRQAGFTERRFIDEQRRAMLRRQIAQSVTGDHESAGDRAGYASINTRMKNAASNMWLSVAAQAGDIPTPTPEALNKYFEERKTLFRAPEYRKITIVAALPRRPWKTDTRSPMTTQRPISSNARTVTENPKNANSGRSCFPTPKTQLRPTPRITKGATFDDIAKEPRRERIRYRPGHGD